MKRAVVFLNGNKPPRDLVFETIKTTDTIICADGGAKNAVASGILPNCIVGDLDSLPLALQKKLQKKSIEWITFSTEKDYTDSELTLRHIIKKGFRDVVIFGVWGDRVDHTVANLLFFATLVNKYRDLRLQIVEPKQTLYFVLDKLSLRGKKGQILSILSLLGNAKGVSTTGLKWKLNEEQLFYGEPRGVSNEFLKEKATIRLKEGVLLVIHSKKIV